MAEVKDPVCGTTVDTATASSTVHKEKTYHFCCPACMDVFAKEPEKYVKKEGKKCCCCR